MIINLINVRLVLSALGETDYGIYTLIAGTVSLLAILRVAMTNASMRFMSHSLGTKDISLVHRTFNTTLLLHLFLGVAMFFIIEAGGLFMFKFWFVIPPEKIIDAKIVFHIVACTTLIMVVTVPYDAVINSHENLFFLSLVDVFGAFLKLGVAIYLLYSKFNLLLVYSFSLLIIQIIQRVIKQQHSAKRYHECEVNFKEYIDKDLAKQILSFSGWNLFGSVAAMSVKQARNILLNMFFGVKLNAANGISMQASNQLSLVSSSITRALNPQLVKSEGGNDRKRVIYLTERATKYSTFLYALFAIPIILEIPYLFSLWLKEIPPYSIIFSRIVLITLLIEKFSFEITNAIRAVGEIRKFQIIETSIVVLNIPISYILLKLEYPPQSIFIIALLISCFIFIERLYFGRRIVNIRIKTYFENAIIPLLLPIGLSSLVSIILFLILSQNIFVIIAIFLQYMGMMTILFWKFSLSKEEAIKFQEIFHRGINYLKGRKSKS